MTPDGNDLIGLQQRVLYLAQTCITNDLSLTTAESCTGGGLAYYMTQVSGSSQWFERGFVTYSNQSKIDLLNVNPMNLEKYEAASEVIAHEMAEGALQHSKATISVATTGIAGPSGGSIENPVGTVWFGFSHRNQLTLTEKHKFTGNRQTIRLQAIEFGIERLLDFILTNVVYKR